MSTTLAFLSLDASVDRAALVYHLAHMLVRMSRRVLLVDLDPQASLSAMCLTPARLDEAWDGFRGHPSTVRRCLDTILGGMEEDLPPVIESLGESLALLTGDPDLHGMEGRLSRAWLELDDGRDRSNTVLGAIHRMVHSAAHSHRAELVLMTLSPSLDAINRTALLASDYVVIPVAPAQRSLRMLLPLGTTLVHWRHDRQARLEPPPSEAVDPLGYVVMQGAVTSGPSPRAGDSWLQEQLPRAYHRHVLRDELQPESPEHDPACLGMLHNHHGLIHLAHDARKPMFDLKPADGAVGAYATAVMRCGEEYRTLATRLLQRLTPSGDEPT